MEGQQARGALNLYVHRRDGLRRELPESLYVL